MSILHKNTLLVLNRNWQAISITTPAQAYAQMASYAATGLDIQHRAKRRRVRQELHQEEG